MTEFIHGATKMPLCSTLHYMNIYFQTSASASPNTSYILSGPEWYFCLCRTVKDFEWKQTSTAPRKGQWLKILQTEEHQKYINKRHDKNCSLLGCNAMQPSWSNQNHTQDSYCHTQSLLWES